MTAHRAAHAIAVTVASNGDGMPATVTVTGPEGQWSAALSTGDADNFLGSVLTAVESQLHAVLHTSHDAWPAESDDR